MPRNSLILLANIGRERFEYRMFECGVLWRAIGRRGPKAEVHHAGGGGGVQRELDELWRIKRPAVTRTVAEAAAQGDRSENAEYIYGKKQLAEIDRRVRYLQQAADGYSHRRSDAQRHEQSFLRRWFELATPRDGQANTGSSAPTSRFRARLHQRGLPARPRGARQRPGRRNRRGHARRRAALQAHRIRYIRGRSKLRLFRPCPQRPWRCC